MERQLHLEYNARRYEQAAQFRCSADLCGKPLLANLKARLEQSTCAASEARVCPDHPFVTPLAWTHRRSRCMEVLEEWFKDGDIEPYLTSYARNARTAHLEYPGTSLDGLREMFHWGRRWGIFPQSTAVRS